MPLLKEVIFSDEQVLELVKQLDFDKKMDLIKEITTENEYRDNFYAYTEGLARKYNIPEMSEEELDDYLHDNRS
jgi:hypothetical protein